MTTKTITRNDQRTIARPARAVGHALRLWCRDAGINRTVILLVIATLIFAFVPLAALLVFGQSH